MKEEEEEEEEEEVVVVVMIHLLSGTQAISCQVFIIS
jgi:hypothetical protein